MSWFASKIAREEMELALNMEMAGKLTCHFPQAGL